MSATELPGPGRGWPPPDPDPGGWEPAWLTGPDGEIAGATVVCATVAWWWRVYKAVVLAGHGDHGGFYPDPEGYVRCAGTAGCPDGCDAVIGRLDDIAPGAARPPAAVKAPGWTADDRAGAREFLAELRGTAKQAVEAGAAVTWTP